MSYVDAEKLLNKIPSWKNEKIRKKERGVIEKVGARKRGNAGNHAQDSQQDRQPVRLYTNGINDRQRNTSTTTTRSDIQ